MRKVRIVFASGIIGAGVLLGSGLGISSAQAFSCPDPDNPCTPVPPKPGPVAKPTVTFGCGTVTVTEGNVSKTLHVLPCPGPVIF